MCPMIKKQQLYNKKTVLVVLLLVKAVVLVCFISMTEKTKAVRTFREVFISGLLENTLSDCAEELNSFRSKVGVLRVLKQDGYRPIALSKIYSNRLAATTALPAAIQHVQETRSTNPFLVTELSSKKDSSKTPEFGFQGVSQNCAKYHSGHMESKQFFVPNVVHYVFIGSDFEFKFITYLSFLSVERFLKPDQIFIHGDVIPSGNWWNVTVERVKNIYHVPKSYSTKAPNGQPFKFMAHISDYIRAEVLLRYGGIYLDPDVLVLKSFDPLRQYPFVLGRESGDSVGNGIMIARKGAPFLRLMLEQYWSYKGPDEEWAKQSVHNVHTLAQVYPHLVHVEETTLNRPNWMERSQIYDGNYNWTTNYAMHLWLRMWPKEKLPSGLQDVGSNTTLGEMVQLILYGSS